MAGHAVRGARLCARRGALPIREIPPDPRPGGAAVFDWHSASRRQLHRAAQLDAARDRCRRHRPDDVGDLHAAEAPVRVVRGNVPMHSLLVVRIRGFDDHELGEISMNVV